MATQYAIDAVFRIIDNASAPMRSISQQGDVAAHAMKKAELRMNAIGNAAKTAVKGAAVGAFAALGVGIASATKQYIEFDQAITSSGALFKDLDSTSESFGASMKALGKTARGVAAVTEFNAVDTAGALTKMAYAGMTSETAMELLAGTTDLATAAGTDLTTAVDIATDVLGAMNLESTANNLQRVSDVMAKTASTSNTSLEFMFETIKYAGPAFTTAGQSIETLSAALGVMANAGIKSTQAGTTLRSVFASLAKNQKVLEGMGVQIQDTEGNFLNFFEIMGGIKAVTDQMGSVEKIDFIQSIFGKNAGPGISAILTKSTEELKLYESQLINSAGAAAQMAAVMRGSIANQINVLKSGLTELGFKFVEAFKNQGSEALQNLITYVQNFDPAPLIATLTTAFDVLGNIVGAIWNMKEFLIPLIAGIEAYKVAMMGITSFLQIVEVIKGLSGAMAGLNAVMLANPVTLIAAGVAAFVAILAALYPHVENIKVSLEGLWEKLNNNPLGRFLATALLPAHNAIMGIVNTLDAFKNGGFVAGIAAIGKAILANIASPIQAVLNMISNIPGVGKWAKAANDKMNAWFFDAGNQTVVEKINPVIENKNGNAPTVDAPVTQGDRMAYSREESVSDVNLNVAMAPGLTGSVSGKAPGVSFTTTSSGNFGK